MIHEPTGSLGIIEKRLLYTFEKSLNFIVKIWSKTKLRGRGDRYRVDLKQRGHE